MLELLFVNRTMVALVDLFIENFNDIFHQKYRCYLLNLV